MMVTTSSVAVTLTFPHTAERQKADPVCRLGWSGDDERWFRDNQATTAPMLIGRIRPTTNAPLASVVT
jgi:hypothetical protein